MSVRVNLFPCIDRLTNNYGALVNNSLLPVLFALLPVSSLLKAVPSTSSPISSLYVSGPRPSRKAEAQLSSGGEGLEVDPIAIYSLLAIVIRCFCLQRAIAIRVLLYLSQIPEI